ncbi:hypothetical protein EYF80_017193 [Liparis tanakae]|uniref:Uncharacterized protein n=1 Tax=Liparis tanakae TaxID=230148 RepID=A0A4Z2I3D4_9TELE|nr:hypothetical protein EYF80_017193 [Liparis tanakae]
MFHLSSFSLRDILRLSASDSFLVTSLETASSRFWATLEDGDGRHDEGIPVEESGGLRGKVSAEVLEEEIFLRLLLAAAFGSHVCGSTVRMRFLTDDDSAGAFFAEHSFLLWLKMMRMRLVNRNNVLKDARRLHKLRRNADLFHIKN